MSREIKFRVWDKVKKKMSIPIQLFKDIETDFGGAIIGAGFDLNDENMVFLQFTGLKDKNGKEIYEGDIVKLGSLPTKEEPEEDLHIAQIMFSKGQFWTTYYGFPVYSWACNDKCFIEVIGNIYEHPNLLKEQE